MATVRDPEVEEANEVDEEAKEAEEVEEVEEVEEAQEAKEEEEAPLIRKRQKRQKKREANVGAKQSLTKHAVKEMHGKRGKQVREEREAGPVVLKGTKRKAEAPAPAARAPFFKTAPAKKSQCKRREGKVGMGIISRRLCL